VIADDIIDTEGIREGTSALMDAARAACSRRRCAAMLSGQRWTVELAVEEADQHHSIYDPKYQIVVLSVAL
jgi:hypothetical protein